jgi:hypothetical protein
MQDKYPPIARNQDPWTSHAAGDAITVNGQRQTLAEICVDCVYKHPGLTAGEIGDLTGLGHPRVWRRLSDLKNLGKVVQGTARQWHGKAQVTWWPLDIQPPTQQPRLL